MPEGPELHLAAKFITAIGERTLFGGKVVKSVVSTKNPDVPWDKQVYRVRAVARGKELKVVLKEGEQEAQAGETLDIVFRFGMSGSFKYTPVSELHKHAHLQFYTISEPTPMVLSFVDYRRFGRWKVQGDWGTDRGPDALWEYPDFRSNVLENLNSAAFNKPICETMLNQKYFNGIGNYLRAEILYRCGICPFDEAREVLSELKPFSKWFASQMKQEDTKGSQVKPDLLDLCHILPKEVISLSGSGKGYNVDPDADEDEYSVFREWLQCYNQDGMKNVVDHNGRTMWFAGEPGSLKPKGAGSRKKVERHRKIKKKQENEKEMKEQNRDSCSAVGEANTDTAHCSTKTHRAGEAKKTESKKTVHGRKTRKATESPGNVKKVNVKEEGLAGLARAVRVQVKSEKANAEPRRRSARLSHPQ